jgi:ATP-dependent Clp protease ATP-binding subunit ClpA
MRFDKFTLKVQEALQDAQTLATTLGHQSIEPEHLLACFLQQPDSIASAILTKLGASPQKIEQELTAHLKKQPSVGGSGAGQVYLGGRLNRLLDKAMCPRFHVDHVPVRLITTYAGIGSQWLREGVMDRRLLSRPEAEPTERIEQIHCGEVALLKGTKWHGNEGHGLIHRSPAVKADERRLILTLDWLA